MASSPLAIVPSEKTQKHIELSLDNGGWSAKFIDDLDIYRLFDTDTIPTAFTRHAVESEVVAAIQRLNPWHVVTVNH
jgi:hypothetical protein